MGSSRPRADGLPARAPRRAGAGSARCRVSDRGRDRVGANHDRVDDRRDLVGRQVRALGVVPDRLGARRLVDADGAELAVALVDDVAADPADVTGHLLVTDALGAGGGLLQGLGGVPAVATADGVELHCGSFRVGERLSRREVSRLTKDGRSDPSPAHRQVCRIATGAAAVPPHGNPRTPSRRCIDAVGELHMPGSGRPLDSGCHRGESMRRGKHRLRAIAGLAIAASVAASAITAVQTVGPEGGATAYGAPAPRKAVGPERALAAMPLAFVPNQGQVNARVRYYAVGNHYAFFATRDELMLSLTKDEPAVQLALALRFIGHDPQAAPTGAERAAGHVNYLRGRDAGTWK